MVWSAAMERTVTGVSSDQCTEADLSSFREIATSTNITDAACPVLQVPRREERLRKRART